MYKTKNAAYIKKYRVFKACFLITMQKHRFRNNSGGNKASRIESR